jgi:endogenous inhibitor of DNA gyrase (YacG/DUF329 family)
MNGDRKSAAAKRRRRSCPMCGKPAMEPHVPFCSDVCADRDLGLWFQGAYRIPAAEPPDEMADDMTENEGADEGGTDGAERGEDGGRG